MMEIEIMLGKFKQKLLNTKLISFLMKKRYDCIVSIGQGCLTIRFLEKYKLRKSAYPLDWTFIPDYYIAINLVKNKFKDYFNKNDLEYWFSDPNSNNNVYRNINNKIIHMHVFPKNSECYFDELYENVNATYQKRIKRFFNLIDSSSKILLLFIERAPDKGYIGTYQNKDITNDIIKSDIDELNKIYNTKCFDILYAKHDETLQLDEYKLQDKILYINNTFYLKEQDRNNPCWGNYTYLFIILNRLIGLKSVKSVQIFIRKLKCTFLIFNINFMN